MLKNRVIPCLLIKDRRLVKTQKFKKPAYVGDPVNVVRIFNEKEVDEIILLDINASKNNCAPDFEYIEEVAGECFMPLCYGGGISTVQQAEKLFTIGVEKICIQTALLNDFSLINEIVKRFGVQSIVVSVDVKSSFFGGYKFFSSSRKRIKIDYQVFIQKAIDAGTGEIILNVVDNDGCMSGMQFELINEVSSKINVPLIAMGGVGSLEDIRLAVNSGASAVAAGAFFVYQGPHRAVLISYPKYEDIERLLS